MESYWFYLFFLNAYPPLSNLRNLNTMKTLSFISAFISISILLSCSTAKISTVELDKVKMLQPPSDKALVYFVRPSSIGTAIKFGVSCDGKELGSTKGKRFIYAIVDTGMHTFVCTAENKSELILKTEAGKIYFIEQQVKMGIVAARTKLVRLDEVSGRKKLEVCKLSGSCPACSSGS
jgi:hypothetical protein